MKPIYISRSIVLVGLSIGLVSLFQNCSNGYQAQSSTDSSSSLSNRKCEPHYVWSGKQCKFEPYACSISNGSGTADQSGSCFVASCNAGYHPSIDTKSCEPDSIACAISNGVGKQTWNGTTYSGCEAVSCNSNFHIENKICVSNSRSCAIANGTGAQSWDGNAYSACTVVRCNMGYSISNNTCVANPMACPITNGTGFLNGSTCILQSCNAGYHANGNKCDANTMACTIANGTGTQTWNGTMYSACMIQSCNATYHIEAGACMSDTKTCTGSNGSGTQTWNGTMYSACVLTACSANYHLEAGACLSNTKVCTVTNGAGTQTWNGTTYGTCMIASCNSGYHIEGLACMANTKACTTAGGASGTQTWDGTAYGACQTSSPVGQSGNWNLIFSDEFDQMALSSNWEPSWFTGNTISPPVASGEAGCYDPKQVSVSGGHLQLTAVKSTNTACKDRSGAVASYASGLVNTRKSFLFTYGYVEARVYLPPMPGSTAIANWPAVWTDGTGSWPSTGEFDIMEGLSGHQPCWHYHYLDSAGKEQGPGGCVNQANPSGWHTYGMNWQAGKVTFYYDGVKVGEWTSDVVGAQHFLILNYGLKTSYGIVTDVSMLVDYIRVWKSVP